MQEPTFNPFSQDELILGIKSNEPKALKWLYQSQYPKIEKFIEKEKKSEKYRLNVVVNNPKPITRFIMGLKDEIDILGSKEFISIF